MRFLLLLLIPALSFAQNGLVTIKLKGGSSGVSGWGLNGNSIVDSNFLGTTNSKDLVFKTKNTEAMRIDTNGLIGLGTESPAAKLSVNGSQNDTMWYPSTDLYLRQQNYLNDDIQGIPFYYSVSITDTINQRKKIFGWRDASAGGGFSIIEYDAVASAVLFGFTIDSNSFSIYKKGSSTNPQIGIQTGNYPDSSIYVFGNADFGINTSTPTAKLHVNGTTRLEGTPQATTPSDSVLVIDDLGNVFWKTMLDYDSIGNYCFPILRTDSLYACSPLSIGVNNTGSKIEAVYIDSTGNVGIGTNAPIYKLQTIGTFEAVVAYGGVFGDSASHWLRIDSSGTYLASISAQVNLQENIMALTADSGVIMQTNTGANVGIGTATPTAKLHVNGTTRLEGTPQSTTSDSLLTIDGQGNVAWRIPYYYGTDTLTNGVDTVWTSDVTANSNIQLTSNGLNGSTQSGDLDVTIISAGNYFVVNSLKSNTTVETGDQRKYYWFFIRKP